MKKETLISISERTGFSITTVSRVLNEKAKKYRISDATIKIIKEEALKCNYEPNLSAQSLRTKKTYTLGLVIPSIDNPFFSNIANVIIREARSYGYTVILTDTMEDEQIEKKTLNSLLSRNIDGIIMVPSGNDPTYLEEICKNQTPIVLIDRYFDNTNLSYVSTDNYLGSFNATQLLISYGHKRILCIQGKKNSVTTKERVRGYHDALQKNGLLEYAMVHGEDFSIQNGYIETKLALNQPQSPTAIFALSNTILLGTLKAINEEGLKIPDDLSVISFDNNIFLDFFNPAISRIGQPIEEIGIISMKILQRIINKEESFSCEKILLPPKMIFRDSIKINDKNKI